MKAAGTFINMLILSGIVLSLAFKQALPVVLVKGSMDPCLKEVKDIYDQMYNILPEAGKTYLFTYSIHSTLNAKDKEGRNITSASDVELFSSKAQYRFISKSISVYQDKDNKFTVVPAQKIVYWADSNMGLVKGGQLEHLRRAQDTIFRHANVVSCQKQENDSINKIVKVVLEKKMAEYLQIRQVSYYINTNQKTLKRIYIEYTPKSDVLAVDFTFKTADYNYTKNRLDPVRPIFIDGTKGLKKSYQGYKLIDVRKKNK